MRFIPDDTTFTNPQRERAVAVPEDYTPPNFRTRALQSTRVELTWDEPDAVRLPEATRPCVVRLALSWNSSPKPRVLSCCAQKRVERFQWENKPEDELRLSDFKAYLAGSSEEEEEDEEEEDSDEESDGSDSDASDDGGKKKKQSKKQSKKKAKDLPPEKLAERDRLRRLLLGDAAVDKKDKKKSKKHGKKDKKDKKVKKDKKDKKKKPSAAGTGDDEYVEGDMESTFVPGLGEDILNRIKQRELEAKETPFERTRRLLKEKKRKRKLERAQGGGDGDDDVDEDDPFGDRGNAFVELGGGAGGGSGAAAGRGDDGKKAKKKKKLQRKSKDDDFAVDLADERFAAVLEDHRFALDPQDKNFKNTKVRACSVAVAVPFRWVERTRYRAV